MVKVKDGTRRWVCAYCARAKVVRAKPKRCGLCGSAFQDVSELEAGVTPGELNKAKQGRSLADQRRLDDGFTALEFCDLEDLGDLSLKEVGARRASIRAALTSLRAITSLGKSGRQVVDVAIGRLAEAERGCGSWLEKWGSL